MIPFGWQSFDNGDSLLVKHTEFLRVPRFESWCRRTVGMGQWLLRSAAISELHRCFFVQSFFFFFVCFFSGFLGESRHLQRPDYIFGQQGLHRSDIYRSASRVIVTIKRCRCMPGIEIKANTMNVWMKNALILGVEALASNLIHQAQRVLSTHHPHHYLPPHYSPPQHPQANPQIAAPDSSQPSSPH